MSEKTRLQRLETEVNEAEMRRWAEELAAEHGLEVDALLREARRIHARIELLKRTHPLQAVDGKENIEPHVRILAAEEGLDPEKILADMRRLEERRKAERDGEPPKRRDLPARPTVTRKPGGPIDSD